MDFNKWNPFWATCCAVMGFLIIVGNSLTIVTLLKKKFRKGPHFLLISLAVADLFVGCLHPLYLTGLIIVPKEPEVVSFSWTLYVCVNVSSIFHLAVISVERLHATLRPFRHRNLNWKVYCAAITTPWILSVSFAISRLLLRRFLKASDAIFFVIAFLTTPLLVTCFSYFVIWKKTTQSRNKVRSFRQNQEARFSRTIFIVTAASFVTWMPFQLYNIVMGLSPSTFTPSPSVYRFVILVQFSNSFVNVVVYFFRFPSYRKALLSCVSCKRKTTTITTSLTPPRELRSSRAFES
ncbi:melatonin receptor type 1A-like [Acropora millepora]|uniref:melatonin receptor type 1A-like n=1 Tax=Acropora millepora TaxID=45264 RepID=UPI001CF5E3FB|nr:melatonin receptor type 1A-like [Acropora millepora]